MKFIKRLINNIKNQLQLKITDTFKIKFIGIHKIEKKLNNNK